MMRELTYTAAAREGLAEEMARDSRIFVVGEGIGVRGGNFNTTQGLYELYGPMRLRDTPIVERGFVGGIVPRRKFRFRCTTTATTTSGPRPRPSPSITPSPRSAGRKPAAGSITCLLDCPKAFGAVGMIAPKAFRITVLFCAVLRRIDPHTESPHVLRGQGPIRLRPTRLPDAPGKRGSPRKFGGRVDFRLRD